MRCTADWKPEQQGHLPIVEYTKITSKSHQQNRPYFTPKGGLPEKCSDFEPDNLRHQLVNHVFLNQEIALARGKSIQNVTPISRVMKPINACKIVGKDVFLLLSIGLKMI